MVDPDDSLPHSRRPTCAEHGLATGPDGACILCRRSSAAPAVDMPTVVTPPRRLPWATLASVVLLFSALGLGYSEWKKAQTAPQEGLSTSLESLENDAQLPSAIEPPTDDAFAADGSTTHRTQRGETDHEFDAFAEQAAPPDPAPDVAGPSDQEGVALEYGAVPSAPTPASMSVQDALGQLDVTLYATSWCGYCEKARRFFGQSGIRYTEKDIEVDLEAARRHKELNPDGGVPVAVIDGRTLQGFSEDSYASAVALAVERRTGQRVRVVPSAR